MDQKQQQHRRSLTRGALIAPWIVPLGLPIFIIGDLLNFSYDNDVGIFVIFMSWFVLLGVPFTYIVTLGLVLPMALWLRAKNALSSARLCVWCAILGPVTFFAYANISLKHPLVLFDFNSILIYAGFGLASGVAFCAASGVRLLARKETTS